MTRRRVTPLFAKRRSPLHGFGIFARRRIRRDCRIVEYAGKRFTAAAIRARYDEDDADDPHTLLFRVSADLYIDASLGGNDARCINHSCDPNCEAELSGEVISIRAIRNIQPGSELTYDYALEIEEDYSPARGRLYACHCGAACCRGTMLDEKPRKWGHDPPAPGTKKPKRRP